MSKLSICYLILCHNNPEQIAKLIDFLASEASSFVIHVDKKSKSDFTKVAKMERTWLVPSPESVVWGNAMKAILLLSEYALNVVPNADYYCLISGADFPVKKTDFICRFLESSNGKDFIQGTKLPSQKLPWADSGKRRINAYEIMLTNHSSATIEPRCFSFQNFRNFAKIIKENSAKIVEGLKAWMFYPGRKPPFGMNMYGGEVWWILTQETLKSALKWDREHPEYAEYHKDTQIRDELYLNTIVWNISNNVSNDIKRYISWSKMSGGIGVDPSPRWMNYNDDKDIIDDCIKNNNILFVRKVAEQDLVDYIIESYNGKI